MCLADHARPERLHQHRFRQHPLLLAAAGPITAIPLLLFASGARKIPLSVLGLLQYLSPTMQFLLGVWLFHEAFTPTAWSASC
jgi:RarD protein